MAPSRSLYEILNVAPDAEPVVVEAAYRALMKKYHPDQASGEAAAGGGPSAADINRAFAVLRDPQRRADYDGREWTKQQDVQMARYQPPPPPRSRALRVFGWSGWIVAAVMGGLVAVLATQASELAEQRAAAARASVETEEPDLSSQPRLPVDPLLTPATVAAIRAEALREVAPPPPSPAPPAVAPLAEAPLAEPSTVAARTIPETASGKEPPQRTARPRRVERPRPTAREKDFLEREGYIY